MVADVLSRKQHDLHAIVTSIYESDLKNLIKTTSREDLQYINLTEQCINGYDSGVGNEFQIDAEGFMLFKTRIYILASWELNKFQSDS